MKLSKILLFSLLVLPTIVIADNKISCPETVYESCTKKAEEAFKKCEKERSGFIAGMHSYVQTCQEIQRDAYQQCLKSAHENKEKKHVHGPGCKHAHKKGLSEGRHI